MKRFEVTLLPSAYADLLGLHEYIVGDSGVAVADAYIDRLEAACLALESFPHRGRKRDDIRPGLRTVGFERRATIVFQIVRDQVFVARIFCGGQNFERELGEADAS